MQASKKIDFYKRRIPKRIYVRAQVKIEKEIVGIFYFFLNICLLRKNIFLSVKLIIATDRHFNYFFWRERGVTRPSHHFTQI